MGRAPCCEKMGLKRGPWTREEDEILINYINLHGHGNWRALPKQAGLLRCGKSCRLRWINYLRPDIKRGNFTQEEEDTIIKLHAILGNRWSAIAGRLPGRTDNEIKNVWHTHLKKRLKKNEPKTGVSSGTPKSDQDIDRETEPNNFDDQFSRPIYQQPNSPLHSSSDASSATSSATVEDNIPELDENFWSEVFTAENPGVYDDFPAVNSDDTRLQFLFTPVHTIDYACAYNSSGNDGMDYWCNILNEAGELPELSEF